MDLDPTRGRLSLVVLLENHLEDLEAVAVTAAVAIVGELVWTRN